MCAGPDKGPEGVASHEADSTASSHAIHYKKKRIQSHYLMLPSGPLCPRLQLRAGAKVLLHTVDPRILIADEATTALDVTVQA